MADRIIGVSRYLIDVSGHRVIGRSSYRAVELSGGRVIGRSSYRVVGMLGWHDTLNMAIIKAIAETENGKSWRETGNLYVLERPLAPALNDTSYSCLRFIDPYGDTIFNCLQNPGIPEGMGQSRGFRFE